MAEYRGQTYTSKKNYIEVSLCRKRAMFASVACSTTESITPAGKPLTSSAGAASWKYTAVTYTYAASRDAVGAYLALQHPTCR